MALVDRLTVHLNFDGNLLDVGELVTNNKQIFFKYYSRFLETQLQISPFKLPLTNEITTPKELFFEGLFGVFNDSLPDGWGRLLVDRYLLKKQIPIHQISPLDRLALIGNNSLGALQYTPQYNLNTSSYVAISLSEIAQDMQKVLQGSSNEVIDELYNLGGSSGGARPKIMVGYNEEADRITHGTTALDSNYTHWIIKFPSSTDLPDVAHIEYAYYLMAKEVGLQISDSKLFKGNNSQYFFGTQRFDRINNKRLHLHSASGLLHDNFRLSNLDYGHIMDAAFRLENHVKAYEKVFRLACFNVYTHNRDDHSKNFAYLMSSDGKWTFAPSYDLTYSSSSHGQHSTTINGEGSNPTQENLLALANHFDIKNAKMIINEVKETVNNWTQFAHKAGVSKTSENLIRKVIQQQLKN